MAGALATALALPSSILPLPFKPSPFSSSNLIFFPKPLSVWAPLTATSAQTKRRESSAVAADFDSDYSDFEDDDEEDEEDEDEEFVAFKDMREWELNKPAGFGVGKVYDTTLEEKLLEEIERDRIALLAADKSMTKKSSSLGEKPQKQLQPSQKNVVPSGPCVRLGNLPKKKNIHRDLQAAFKGFGGIVKISPAVAGNKKTRDPVCKGFAFVEFVSEEAAVRFVNTCSKQEIPFGRVQKQISCDIMNHGKSIITRPQSSAQTGFTNSEDDKLQEEYNTSSRANVISKDPELVMNGANASVSDSKETEMGTAHLIAAPLCDNEDEGDTNKLSINMLEVPSKKQQKKTASRKRVVHKKSTQTAKLSLPSSMTRLKIKERAVLTGVFTKYSKKVASASN